MLIRPILGRNEGWDGGTVRAFTVFVRDRSRPTIPVLSNDISREGNGKSERVVLFLSSFLWLINSPGMEGINRTTGEPPVVLFLSVTWFV